jgi:dihydrofolate reductase
MRKIIVLEHITLDGIIQAPGDPDEDTSGGFPYGGWIPSNSDDELGSALSKQMSQPFDLLLGRKTFEIWEAYWPDHADAWPAVMTATKYVASTTRTVSDWQPSVFLNGDVAEQVVDLKQQDGADIHIWGSANLLQTLIRHDLVDTFWLMIYPLTLGTGKRLFADGTMPRTFTVTESMVTPSGVIVVTYERMGEYGIGNK